ncbi:FxSxx-COOH system tetratricopeptide repeat protein [Actinoplanes sp. NPDC049596]|uniref:FxSxx-COOH system tetratricopeptide repeat protein n=1 Tax=unclassified Actinoplanes TaxID=2626549 RepID=UPI003437FE83
MPVNLPGPDQLSPGPLRELVTTLHDLYGNAGRPGVRVISSEIRHRQDLRDTVSHETVSLMLRGEGLPRWDKVECVVRVLAARSVSRQDEDAEVRRFHSLWLAASDAPPSPPAEARPAARAADFMQPAPIQEPSESARVPQLPRMSGHLPVRNANFTGRDLVLDEVRRHFTSQSGFPAVLHGLGGTGKTQIAVEYLYRWAAPEMDVLWWVPAEDPMVARASLATLAERLGLPTHRDLQQTVRAVISELERGRTRWLLVFDNAEMSDDLIALLPAVGGQVLLTSRDPGWASVGAAIEVGTFDRAESIQFLRRRGRDISGAEADLLADRLGDLPLALEQVAAAQSATAMPVSEYLALFDEHLQELIAAGRPDHYPATVVAFVRIAVDRLRPESPSAAHLIELFAHLGAEPVSVTLLRSGQDAPVSAPLARALRDPIQMGRAIRDLNRFGLARVDQGTQRIEVHRLVQLALREALDPAALERGRDNVVLLLAAANPEAPDDVRTWALHADIAPHVLPAGLIDSGHLPAWRVVVDQVRYLSRTGDYEGSRRLADLAVARWSAAGEAARTQPAEELIMRATFELAESLRALGSYERSRALSIEAWDRLRAHPGYGPGHEFTLRVAGTVSAHHRVNGDYRAALDIDRDILARYQAGSPPDDPQTLSMMNNLAVTMRLLGDYWGAYQVDEEVWRKWLELFGPADSRTLVSVSNLARDHLGLGQFERALELQQEAQPRFQAQGGARHHHVLLGDRTIAVALRKCGRFAEALRAARANHDACHSHFGSDHENTLAATMTLANASHADAVAGGRPPTEAKELATLAAARYRRIFGERNPLSLAAEINHAIILRALGDRLAREIDRMTLGELRQTLGDEHPYTLSAATNYATDLSLDREFDAARELLERTLAASVRVRGVDHPDTLACALNLALATRRSPDALEVAQQLYDNTIGRLRRVLGPHHPATLDAARGNQAECDIEPPPT